ncbi:transcription-repair coupling factor (superfamily II helicase) [Thermosporothrix hazakensis]|uniref:Transcription-repair-coupling factor n=2 Tax=Thermosporothrix TaxID=768650 RepID=A0A326TVW8_THEHA|nr:transcription-repair coupling factor [Thermosporothrix hazakensis]PZW21005.1 transcription-repair coupling factor (superfamily II helicase) [Thermosporothrix hazakensis]BBH91143.1 transcription-repair-coupling factor [Thermosporothrix sp. COM3]GCE49288.1 transcription-repair-coupling factor [Thermosporothrix hazakensis]
MTLQGLLSLLAQRPEFRRLLDMLRKREGIPLLTGITEAARPYVMATLSQALKQPLLIVAQDENQANQLADALKAFMSNPGDVFFLPDRDALPYERLIGDTQTTQQRMQALIAMVERERTSIVVCSARSLSQLVIPPQELAASLLSLEPGQEVDLTSMLDHLYNLGYEPVAEVETPGQFSHRGGIIDLFPPTMSRPVRIEFFGDEIESLRTFDQATQRSLNPVYKCIIGPAREALPVRGPEAVKELQQLDSKILHRDAEARWNHDLEELSKKRSFEDIAFYLPYLHQPASLLDYLPQNGLLIIDNPGLIQNRILDLEAQAKELKENLERERENPAHLRTAFLNWSEIELKMQQYRQVRFADVLSTAESEFEVHQQGGTEHLMPPFSSASSYGGRLRAFVLDCHKALENRDRIIIVTTQARRMAEVLGDDSVLPDAAIHVSPGSNINQVPEAGTLTLIQGQLAEGWQCRSLALYIYTDTEIFGWSKRRSQPRRKPITPATFLAEVNPGDYVVHQEHGIGRFEGLVKMNLTGVEREYLLIQYAGTDKLYIPTDQLDRVTRYIGMGDSVPALSKLGTSEWTRAKSRVKENVQDIARDLLKLYSAREAAPGHAFPPDSEQPWLQELEDAFPYEETPDQARAIAEVKADMEQPKPMDRLVCGDVGYGKTEVALRAAFKAVLDQRQVAVLVPTTVLALQHYNTFKERLKAYPVRVELLSRFRSEKEQKQVLEDLALGKVDVVIGTHRLLQKDVVFFHLGLLIIDEEQRFGVVHKERLKQLRNEIDVLTMTATPIPRTLHMSLVNLRDMSIIETPPQERLPIRTTIREYDEALIREAILRELDRGGQVFFVHNRVQGIQTIAQKLQKIVPEARIIVGHGQMNEEQLEKVMLSFTNGEYDVLISTTIIENGLDIPNANTIIVNNAAFFGLSQLYQLRGRVGRGTHQAYAYFLYNKDSRLTPIQEKRLRAIYEATELGAGFRIAMKDLEIRGAGNLLGAEQSGFMNAVGFDLYCKLLAEAIQELQGKPVETVSFNTTVDLPLDAYLPDSFINDRTLKVNFYQRLASLTQEEQVEAMEAEMLDRFGPLPKEVQNLLALVRLKVEAAKLGFESITVKDNAFVLTVKRSVIPNRIALYRRFRNSAQVQQSVIRIPRHLFNSNWLAQLRELLPEITATVSPTA